MDSAKTVDKHGVGLGRRLGELAPELLHLIALSGWLTFEDVAALSQTCVRMKIIFVDDEYGRDIHYALKGVVENVTAKRWVSARYAVKRRWFVEDGEDGEDEESVWRMVAGVAEIGGRLELGDENEVKGWESVMMMSLSLPAATGWEESWNQSRFGRTMTSLLHVGSYVGSKMVVAWGLERGGKVLLEARNFRRDTPLLVACRQGHVDVVKVLVEAGASVTEVRDARGRGVLSAASEAGHVDVVEYLLKLGVLDPDEGWYENTPMVAACERGHVDVVRVLMEAGASVGCGMMVTAAGSGQVDLVRLLMELGKGGMWDRALSVASQEGHVDVVRLLVEEGGVDVNRASRLEATPLFLAYLNGENDVVRVLLELGADVGIANDDGDTVLDLARMRGRHRIVELLESWEGGE